MSHDWRPGPVSLSSAVIGGVLVSAAVGFAVASYEGVVQGIGLLAVASLVALFLIREKHARLYSLLPHATKLAYGVALMSALTVLDVLSDEDAPTERIAFRAVIAALGVLAVFHRVRASALEALGGSSTRRRGPQLPGVSVEESDARWADVERLVNEYGNVLGKFSGVLVADETELPASKDAIGAALRLAYLAGPSDPLKTGYVELAGFQQGVGAEPILDPVSQLGCEPHDDISTTAAARATVDAGDDWLRWMKVTNAEAARRSEEVAAWDQPADD